MNGYGEDFKVKNFGIETGKFIIALHNSDARELGVFPTDRVEITNPKTGKKCVAVVDITEKAIKKRQVGLFYEVEKALQVKNNSIVSIKATEPIKSLDFIKRKMQGEKLSADEIEEIVQDLTENKLSEIEASAFVSAVYIRGFDLDETIAMTNALIDNGARLKLNKGPVVDKHSVGGVNGRATMIIVPIVACAGLYIPKTSSRSITSCAGTADAMEVLAPVCFSLEKIKSITEKTGGIIAWGGAVDLVPADDKIIKLEHPLSLDPEGQVIASVLAKKASVGSEYVVIDLPVGKNVKIRDKDVALRMAKKFVEVGKHVGMEVEAVITNGEEPCGPAFGPAIEAKCALEVLERKRVDALTQKSCELAGAILELAGNCKEGEGFTKAKKILESGRALKKMKEIIKAQGGKIDSSEKIKFSKMKKQIFSDEQGTISEINVRTMTRIARNAGAPANKLAGIMLEKEVGDSVEKGELLYTIYAENKTKLKSALKYALENKPITFERMIMSKIR